MPRVYNRRAFGNGHTQSPQFAIPLGATRITLRLSRDAWPGRSGQNVREREIVEASIYISLDGGLTWPLGAMFGTTGGSHITQTGALSPESSVTRNIPDPTNSNRFFHVDINAKSGFSSQVDVDFL